MTLCGKVSRMEHHAAAEHLEVIRTLMERSALYRRTLAPIMLYLGSVGTLASMGSRRSASSRARAFVAWWLAAALVALAGAFVIARRQALAGRRAVLVAADVCGSRRPWSRRLAAGLILSLAMLLATGPGRVALALRDPQRALLRLRGSRRGLLHAARDEALRLAHHPADRRRPAGRRLG